MPTRRSDRRPKTRRSRAGLLPLSTLSFVVAASAQTISSDKESSSTASGSAKTAAESFATPAFSRGPNANSTPSPLVSELTVEEPGVPANTPPSFYGGSGSAATSSVGLPDFAATPPSARTPTAANYPLQWGPFSFHPHLAYDYTYADGVLVTPGQPTISVSHAVSPGLTVVSKHLTLDYTPSLVFYSKGPYDDTVNHAANLAAGFGYNDWKFSLSQRFSDYNSPLVETGMQTETMSFGTVFTANWNLSERWFFDFTLSQQIQDNQNFQSSRQWSTIEWANYRLIPALSLGAGLGGGYSAVDLGSDSTFEQIQGRVNWQPSKRLSASLNGGVEIRQFLDAPRTDSLVNPIMGASINYQAFEYTSFYLSASRTVDSSLFQNQITENASVSAGVNQRLLKYLNLNVSGGFRRTDYKGTFVFFNQSFPTLRRDDYGYISTSLGTTFLKRGLAAITYTHSDLESTLPGYTYDTDQISFQISYRF